MRSVTQGVVLGAMELFGPGWIPRLSALLLLLALLPRGALGLCGAPPRLTFAELQDEFKTQTEFPVGTTVRYNCRPGYQRVPGVPPTSVCGTESAWSEPKQFCQRKSCGHPGDIDNGRVHITDLQFGSEITFSCDEGFRLHGSKTSRCVIEGTRVTWDREIPFCEGIPCRPPPEIMNGRYSGDPNNEYTYGSTVTYSCNPVPRGTDAFSLIGQASIHCISDKEQNGIWSGAPPECKVVKCSNVDVENGRKLSGFGPSYTYQDAITFGCKTGYILVGSNLIICQANNSWAPATPHCEKISPSVCHAPEFSNGKLRPSQPQYVAGDAVTLTCEANYVLPNGAKSMTVHCQGNDLWNPPVQTCQLPPSTTVSPSVCSAPAFPNGKMIPSKPQYVPGDAVTLTCETSYVLPSGAKSMTVNCKGNDLWDPPVQTCLFSSSRACPAPIIHNGKVTSGAESAYVVGVNVTIECYSAYTIHGEAKIRCTDTLTWEPVIPECKLRVYIIIIICVIVIAAVLLIAIWIYKTLFSPKGSYQTDENGQEACILKTKVPDENEASALKS